MDAIGIDIGSTNVKAVLVDEAGAVVARAQHPVAWRGGDGAVELDAEALWQAVLASLQQLAATAGAGAWARVSTVGLCGQYSSIVPVDAAGLPLAPMRSYLDRRGTGACFEILARHPEAFQTWTERHPVPPVGGGLSLGHLLSLQLDSPELHAATAAHLEPVDYVAARLTGVLAATQASVFASQLVDNRTLDAVGYDPDLLALSGVDPAGLPPLVPAGSVVGELRADVAAATGLAPTVAVVAGLVDSATAALATGAHAPGRVGIAVGTTGVILSGIDHLGADLDHEIITMPGTGMGGYLVSAENGLAGRSVEHVLTRFVHADDPLGAHAVADPFVGFEAALAASPPGAGGVRFLPWLSGSLAPQGDSAARGGFVGVGLDTSRVDLVRAAAEGVAHNLRWLLGPVEALTGEPADEVVLLGGAARSPQWTQVLADVLGRPVHPLADPGHAGARAAAVWAATRRGETTASPEGERGPVHEPDRSTAGVHDHAQDQFVAVFEALRPLRLGRSGPSVG